MESSIARATVTAAGWMVGWRFFTRIVGIASTLILARILVPEDFGLVAMATTFAAGIEGLSMFGLQQALIRRPAEDQALYDTAFTLQVARAIVTAAIIALGAQFASEWFGEPRLVPLILVLAGVTAILGFENIGMIEFRRDLRFGAPVLQLAVPRLLQVIIAVSFALLYRTYWVLLLGIAASAVARVVLSYVLHPYRPGFALKGWRELAGYSVWIWAGSIAALVWERSDAFILGPELGPARLGVFLLACEVALLPMTELIAPAAEGLFAGFSKAQRQGARVLSLVATSAVTVLVLVAPFAIALSSASGYFVVGLLGNSWQEAVGPIAILAWVGLLSPFGYVAAMGLTSSGAVARYFIVRLAAASIKVLVTIGVLRFAYDLRIVAAAMLLCYAVETTLYLIALRSLAPLGWTREWSGLLRIGAATATTATLLWQLELGWQTSGSGLMALLQGCLVASLAVSLFLISCLVLWSLSGWSDGPETRVLSMARHVLRR